MIINKNNNKKKPSIESLSPALKTKNLKQKELNIEQAINFK